MNEPTYLSDLFLFKNLDFDLLDRKYRICENAIKVDYMTNDTILSASTAPIGIGIISKGSARIYSAESSDSPVLRLLTPGSIFGVASLFMNGGYTTTVIAEENCSVTYISIESINTMCKREPEISLNYIKFLSDRISFLNKKISIFTKGSTEAKLAYFLYEYSDEANAVLTVNYSLLAEMLGIGRASLYRCLDKMVIDNIISRTSKTITVLNRNELIKLIK